VSPPGEHIFASVVLRPQRPADRAFELVFALSLAAAEALEWAGVAPRIKWPNDLEVDDKKIAGILAELADDGKGGLRYAVLGIGLNVNAPADAFPEDLRARATSVQAETGHPASCAHLAATLFERLEEWIVLGRSMGFTAVMDSWRARSSTPGAEVNVLLGDGQAVSGVAEDVDDGGALLVRDDAGKVHRILAGDVTTLRRA
jgi:BirA family biotin operon repressor/biotin-[acetyl-CoA-carboxylase] ligase